MALCFFLGLRRQSSCSAFGSPPSIACANSFRAQVRGVLFELLPAQVFGGFVAFDRKGAEVAREEVSRQGSVRVGLSELTERFTGGVGE